MAKISRKVAAIPRISANALPASRRQTTEPIMSRDKPDNDKPAEGMRNISRRATLQSAGGLLAAAALSDRSLAQATRDDASARRADLTGRLARYMTEARDRALPARVVLAAKHRIVDTFGAIVSGAKLKPGEIAAGYVRQQGGVAEAAVVTTDILTSAVNAAFANGMAGHADETDDFHPYTKAHPGCAVVPAALAMAEKEQRSGAEFLRAVVLGYDLGCRFLMALEPALVRSNQRSAEGYSSTFGAAAAASSLARFDETHMRHAISYAVQQVSGVWSWVRDVEHVEKAFDFSGMGARNGVAAATMVQAGFTGVADALDGERNIIDALSTEPNPEELVADLGKRFYVEETAIKTFPVGYPIQSPLDAFFALQREHGLNEDNVEHILVRLPEDGARIVNDRAMPDVNVQHIMAVALVDREITFENSHSFERMSDPRVLAARRRVELVADPNLVRVEAPRSGFVEVTLRDGRTFNRFVSHAPGTPENPLDTERVNAKARSLMAPILGPERAAALIEHIGSLEVLEDMRELRPYFT
jgi:2-methylcitrate dehydratase PrpD